MATPIEKAIQYHYDNPEVGISKVAADFNVKRSTLRYRLSSDFQGEYRIAHNKRLIEEEEVAICAYIDRLESVNLAVRPEFVTEAANALIIARHSSLAKSPPDLVGPRWTTRFLKRGNAVRARRACDWSC